MPTQTDPTPPGEIDLKLVPGGDKPSIDPQSASALDEALRAEGFNPDGSPYEPNADDIQKKEADDKAAKEAADKKAAEEAAAKGTPTDEEKAKAEKAEKEAADKKAADEAAKGKDELDSVELPPHTKPKTAESFGELRRIAKEKVAAANKERDEIKAKVAELEEKVKAGLSSEEKKELEDLRTFRKSVDVEADPAFKEYDNRVTANVEAIYSKLTAAGFDETAIKKIKEMGGPGEVDWDGLAAKGKISSSLKRFLDGKLFENDSLAEEKKQAIAEAKKNADVYLKNREAQWVAQSDGRATETNKEWSTEVMPKMPWFVESKITADMKPEEKKVAEEHNKLVKQLQVDVKDAIADDSPRMKAMMVAGYAMSQKYAWELARLKTDSEAKLAAVTKELTEAKAMLDRIKKASPGRVQSAAPHITPSKPSSVNTNSSEALDKLLEEAEKENAAKM